MNSVRKPLMELLPELEEARRNVSPKFLFILYNSLMLGLHDIRHFTIRTNAMHFLRASASSSIIKGHRRTGQDVLIMVRTSLIRPH